ncbi:hypothetical protein K458DRAFT_402274 [Lentithecium fluviatile CBS 122367]|uniref:Uncharacterized protein n=1 Tax=Lentithecium fluviatile CBS 122367 TaxID=1168545 RepID=A0A6G1J845_9PLEO|nr:hypothetical protein K458DRAFT_402274 [Lentithecium fluviatile CBS 122367]
MWPTGDMELSGACPRSRTYEGHVLSEPTCGLLPLRDGGPVGTRRRKRDRQETCVRRGPRGARPELCVQRPVVTVEFGQAGFAGSQAKDRVVHTQQQTGRRVQASTLTLITRSGLAASTGHASRGGWAVWWSMGCHFAVSMQSCLPIGHFPRFCVSTAEADMAHMARGSKEHTAAPMPRPPSVRPPEQNMSPWAATM